MIQVSLKQHPVSSLSPQPFKADHGIHKPIPSFS